MTNSIDKRIKYYLILDTETTNGNSDNLNPHDCLFYDFGAAVIDKRGKIYDSVSFINYDIFVREHDLMNSAYYAKKTPAYVSQLRDGSRQMKTLYEIKQEVRKLIEKYNIKIVVAHNARFDSATLNATQRYITKSKYRYFLPYGLEWWDTLKMARTTIGKQKTYIRFCQQNGFVTKQNKPRLTAEILYKYITNNLDFIESHTGFEDVSIEKEIFAKCMAQHKKMEKKLWKD